MLKNIFNKKDRLPIDLNFNITAVLLIVILFGIISTSVIFLITSSNLSVKISASEEADRPADLSITIIKDSSCVSCFDLGLILELLKKENINIISDQKVEFDSSEARELIDRYDIKAIPALIVKGEIEKNTAIKNLFSQNGDIDGDTFVLRKSNPPYIDIATGELKGQVKLTMITDRNCKECYDVTKHEQILLGFGMFNIDSEVLDIGFEDGKEIISKYNINLLPTIIITGEVEYYPDIKNIWSKVGTIESDGVYVFREGVKQMGTYNDIALGKIIKPESKITQ